MAVLSYGRRVGEEEEPGERTPSPCLLWKEPMKELAKIYFIMCVSKYGCVHMSEGAFAGRGIGSPGAGTKHRSISPTLEKRIFMSYRLGLLVWHQLIIGSILWAAARA